MSEVDILQLSEITRILRNSKVKVFDIQVATGLSDTTIDSIIKGSRVNYTLKTLSLITKYIRDSELVK